jgi:hypothetical protein
MSARNKTNNLNKKVLRMGKRYNELKRERGKRERERKGQREREREGERGTEREGESGTEREKGG